MLIGGFEVPVWILLSGAAVILSYLYSTRNQGIFKNAGIPGPTPLPFLGNSLLYFGASFVESDWNLFKKYGRLVGLFEGTTPVLMVYDPEFLKEAFIKNFDKLTNRRPIKIGGYMDYGLFSLEDEHWKYVRTMLSPAFTQGKLKKMMPAIQKCENLFVKLMRQEKGKPVDIRGRILANTMDVIATTAFGIEIDSQTNPDSPFNKNAKKLLDSFESASTLREKIQLVFVASTYFFAPRWLLDFLENRFGVYPLDKEALQYFENLCDQVVRSREADSEGAHDFIQSVADSIVEASENDPDTRVTRFGLRWTRKGLTRAEVIGNSVLFFGAGFQTTGDTLTYLFFELAHNPDIQQKLYEEVISVCDTEEITIDQIHQLNYLEMCINEAMRLYPQGFRFDREAAEDMEVCGVKIAKGTAVTASGYVIHRNPQYWDDPETFDPERFTPERSAGRHSQAFIPFGVGNRSCIGNRLALLEMKMLTIQTLKAFTIEKSEETLRRPLTFRKGALAMIPEKPISLRLVERN